QHTVTGRFNLECPRRADTLGSDDVVHPAALLLDFDDLADGRPVSERLMLVAAAETRTDFNRFGIVDPLDGLQFSGTPRGQADVGHQFPRRRHITPNTLCHFHCGLIAITHCSSFSVPAGAGTGPCSMPGMKVGAM